MSVGALFLLALAIPIARGADDGQGADESVAQVDSEIEAKIEKYIGLARTGRMPVRPQAARRLVKLGEPAATRLRAACGEQGEGMADLGPHLVEVLADFEDPGLRARLWTQLSELDFPWRGAAARALAGTALTAEAPIFWELLADQLAPVRVAAIEALGTVGEGSSEEIKVLSDRLRIEPNDRVRRSGVALLDDWGQSGYLLWLLEDLRRTDRYFRLPFGEQARFLSARLLAKRLGDLHGYKAENSPDDPENARAIELISEDLVKRADGQFPILPPQALAGREIDGNVIGLELRSCRRGEFFLSWNRADVLHVGTSRPLEIPLPPGTVAALEKGLAECWADLGDERYWGASGCDIEQLRLTGPDGEVENFLVSKGPAAIPDLRPAPLDRAVKLLVNSIPEGGVWQLEQREQPRDVRGIELRERVEQALQSIGGEY